jgi:AcrR family transcriptional regulator
VPMEFRPTSAMRRKVQTLVVEMSEDEIARAIGINRSTLRRHFSNELQTGRATVRAEAIEMLRRQAKKGNVAAIKALLQRSDQPPPAKPKPRVAKLGKKQAVALAAELPPPGSGWEDLLH